MRMVKDPVCGMEVDEETTEYKSLYANNVYYFSSSTCKEEFDKNPEKYLQKISSTHHTSHYGGYCGTGGCGAPARRCLVLLRWAPISDIVAVAFAAVDY